MNISILGPNLSSKNQDKGNLHAHAADCGDIKKGYSPYERDTIWTLDVESRLEAGMEVYPPDSFDWDPDDDGDFRSYVGDIWFAPCLKALPDRPEPDLGGLEERPYNPNSVIG